MSSHWTYNNNIIDTPPKGAFGFVYEITNLVTGQKYIGRKYLSSTRRKPPKKGMKRRTVVKSESNWASYTGSCIPLNEDIAKLTKKNFKFEIVAFGSTKGQVNFLEEVIQIKRNVLVDDSYYNDSVGSRRFVNVKITPELKDIMLGL